jgi:hypothetical protein
MSWPRALISFALLLLFSAYGQGAGAAAGPLQASEPAQVGDAPGALPKDCPVTHPPAALFVPPAPYSHTPSDGGVWFGSESLWTDVPANGVWASLSQDSTGYTQKVFWWRKGYSWTAEPEPNLTVSGRRLDAPAPALIASQATNAYASDIQSAMLVGVDFPALGCWGITGHYRAAELSFVVWVAP